jgi:general stress protein 26
MNEAISKATEIIVANTVRNKTFNGEICNLALIDENGYPTTSVITPAKSDGLKTVWLCTMLDSNHARRIAKCSRASVSFTSTEYCVNLVGDIEVIADAAVKSDMWYDGLSYHFPSGENDPNYCVLKFTTKRYVHRFGGILLYYSYASLLSQEEHTSS